MTLLCHGTSLPVATNSVSLDPTLKDARGRSALRVTYKDIPRSSQCAVPAGPAVEIMEAAGAQRVMRAPVQEQNFSMVFWVRVNGKRPWHVGYRPLSPNP